MAALTKKSLGLALVVLVLGVAGYFTYMDYAFPKTRCEGAIKHPDAPEELADCVACHSKTTPQVVTDWNESKHGVVLVKCAVCHGEPDGSGSRAFTASPDPQTVCASCHDPALQRMQAKYGLAAECVSCHPHHQNSMHGNAFENRTASGKTSL
jgi:cytochrome c553